MPYWPYCTECKRPYDFDDEGPFAHCECGTMECTVRPAEYVSPPPGVSVYRKFSNPVSLVDVLRAYGPLDAEGIVVSVSRQALDQAIDILLQERYRSA
jgi:hypothetical protein